MRFPLLETSFFTYLENSPGGVLLGKGKRNSSNSIAQGIFYFFSENTLSLWHIIRYNQKEGSNR